MSILRVLAPALVCAAIATPVSADVTLRLKGSGRMFGTEAQETTEYRKGLKLRTDWTSNGLTLSSIIDLGTGRTIMLWHDSKRADVAEPRQISQSLAKSGFPEMRQSITPTARSRQIAGSTCIVHDVESSTAMAAMEMVPAMAILMQGSVCLVENGPGQADFTAFYRAMAERVFRPDPTQAKEQLAAAAAMAEMYRRMAELGVPFATEMTIGVEGNSPMREMMEKMGNAFTTEVTSVSTDPIPDSMFEIPADYRVTKR